MTIRWHPCGPYTHEATHGPYLARLSCEEPGWWRMKVFERGAWTNTYHAARWKLRRTWRGIVERYELERDRDRLDFLERDMTAKSEAYMDGNKLGMTLRQAIDAARGVP